MIKWKDYISSGDILRQLSGKLYEESAKVPDRFKDFLDPKIDDLISELPEILEVYKRYQLTQAIKIRDIRFTLPWNGKWKQRKLIDIYWLIIHQSLGFAYPNRSNAAAINRYHISHYNWPHGAYCYVVDVNTDSIDFCNSWKDRTNGAGKGWNSKSLHIVLPGDFSGPTYVGKQHPTTSQLKRTGLLCDWLISRKELPNLKSRECVQVLGHFEATKKLNCPGDDIMAWLREWRKQ